VEAVLTVTKHAMANKLFGESEYLMLASHGKVLTSSGALDAPLNSDRPMLDKMINSPVFIVKAINILTIESVLGENINQLIPRI
jgi:hypothetical protein